MTTVFDGKVFAQPLPSRPLWNPHHSFIAGLSHGSGDNPNRSDSCRAPGLGITKAVAERDVTAVLSALRAGQG
jgi:hypothetical protein